MISQSSAGIRKDRHSPFDMDANTFREAGHQLIDEIAGFLSSLPELRVTPAPAPKALQRLLPLKMPVKGEDPAQLVFETWKMLIQNSLLNGHPRFWGYITSSPAPIGMLADLLASAINSNCGAFVLSPMATEIELQTIQWLGELIGYPAGSGIMSSGGNMANFIGFLAARKSKSNWDIRKQGLHPSQGKWRVYCSAETHTWISKATDLFGLGLDAIRWVPVDSDQRMNVSALDQMITEDIQDELVPLLVAGTAGSVGTGAVDPLTEIGGICKKHNCWFHIDGAYGGFAAALPELKKDFIGIEMADSIAIDPHKWLYSPLEAGCTLVRDPGVLTDAFSFHPVYYNFDSDEEMQINFYERGLQNSRGFRALKVWLGLRQAGSEGHIQMIREDIQMAKQLFELLKGYPEIETFTQHLSITTFRYKPEETDAGKDQDYLNKLNQALLNRLQAGGIIFPSNTVLDNNFLLRVCIVNFRTGPSDMEAIPEIILTEGRYLHQELKSKPKYA